MEFIERPDISHELSQDEWHPPMANQFE